jgi:23S rRNA (cytosine1962-C5)-methyltransferase
MDRPRKPPKTSGRPSGPDRRERPAAPPAAAEAGPAKSRAVPPRRPAPRPEPAEPIALPRPPIEAAAFSGARPLGDPLAAEMLETDGWADYALLDSGFGRKLERYGHVRIVRPEEQALWAPRLPEAAWEAADAIFTGDVEEEGPGRWRFPRPLPETWPMRFDPVKFSCRFTSFRHTGVFPEQVAHWLWMRAAIERAVVRGRKPRLLNLFGYTGLASLVAAAAGAEVTHVDASRKSIAWARENQAESGLDHLPIRWICDDAMKFVQRDVRRGARYDAILLDPPKYGRGTNGEVWQLFEHLPEMLRAVRTLLSDDPIGLILTVYAMRSSYASFHELTAETMAGRGGRLASGELFLREAEAPDTSVRRRLATSLFVRWTPEATP